MPHAIHPATHISPRSDLHAPRPPAREALVLGAAHALYQRGAILYRCRSGQHQWADVRDARRCCNGFTLVPVVDSPRGVYGRWERDLDARHDARYTPQQVEPPNESADPYGDGETRTAVRAVTR